MRMCRGASILYFNSPFPVTPYFLRISQPSGQQKTGKQKQCQYLPLIFKIRLKDMSLHISINSLEIYIPPECLQNYLSNLYILQWQEKMVFIPIYGVYILKKCVESEYFYSCPLPQSRLSSKVLSSPSLRAREITHCLRQRFFESLFPQTAEKSGRKFDLLCQNSVRKYEGDLKHQVIYILYDLYFFKRDGFSLVELGLKIGQR